MGVYGGYFVSVLLEVVSGQTAPSKKKDLQSNMLLWTGSGVAKALNVFSLAPDNSPSIL